VGRTSCARLRGARPSRSHRSNLSPENRLRQIHGHDVRIAYDGPSGLVEARKSTPDIVLLDIGLPGMDGYQLATRLRHEENFKNATLIAISGYGQEEDVRLAREAGFDHHLVKPIASDELIKLLRESDR
jgi:DNA-binding response OmpR family regulator